MASRLSARADINLLKYDGSKGPGCEGFVKNVKLFVLEDAHTDKPMKGADVLERICLLALPRQPFAQFLTETRKKSYLVLPDADIIPTLLEDVTKEFSYSSVEEAQTLVGMKMEVGEDPLRYGRRFAEQFERSGEEFTSKAAITMYLRGIAADLRAEVKRRQCLSPTLESTIQLAQQIHMQSLEDYLMEQTLPPPPTATKPAPVVIAAASAVQEPSLPNIQELAMALATLPLAANHARKPTSSDGASVIDADTIKQLTKEVADLRSEVRAQDWLVAKKHRPTTSCNQVT